MIDFDALGPEEWAALEAEQEAEIWAENAWLRDAEGWNRWPDPEDEYEKMLEAMDPQLVECRERYIAEMGYCPF